MNVLLPLTITPEMIGAGTSIAEPAVGETAWVSGGTYAVDDLRIRTTTHKVYSCVQAHSGRTALPENDAAYWLEKEPTQRYMPFDSYSSTAAKSTGSITYVLSPGYFNALALYGLVGATLSVVIKDAPGGTIIYSYEGELSEPPAGWYEMLFLPQKKLDRLVLKNLPIRPTAELTITVSASAGNPVAIGLIALGDYRALAGDADWGGTKYGASAEPVSYSYIKTADDGTTKIKRRTAATSMRATVILPRREADAALALIQAVLDVPVPWVATSAAGYAGLNVFGLGSASVSYDSDTYATINLTVKGMI